MSIGTKAKFMVNADTPAEGIISRVWDRPAADPYVTIKSEGRTFVRHSSTVQEIR